MKYFLFKNAHAYYSLLINRLQIIVKTVKDIAGAILYFAAPISEWVSGQTIFVNGGGEQTLD